jgi:hypothetical protein
MKRTIIFLSFLVCTISFASAQSFGEIRGKVFDKNTNTSIPGASVFVVINGNKIGTVTDINGSYVLKPLSAGIYNVTISYVGYQEVIVNTVTVNPDRMTIMADVQLSNKPVDITKGPEIIGYRDPLIKPEDPSIQTISVKQIKDLPDSKDLTAILRSMTSEIKVSDDGNEIYFRGSRTGDVVYIVDGMKQINGGMGIPSAAIGSISVYTGGVPAKYGDFTGGVVVIESMSYFDWLAMYNARQQN